MAPGVDPRAAVDPGAVLGEGCRVGPYAVLEKGARIGRDCVLGPHAVVLGETELGEGCEVGSFAAVGGAPQHRRYSGEPTRTVLGRQVIVREQVTIHRGTVFGGGSTRVGDRTMLMVGSHVAHDCQLGEEVVLTNGVQLGGHVIVEARAVLGGMAAVAQFLRVGEASLVAAGARVEIDVPPYHIVAGDRARVRGLNVVGLVRRGTPESVVQELVAVHRLLFRSGRPLATTLGELHLASETPREVVHLVAFLEASLAAPRRRSQALEVPEGQAYLRASST